MREKRMLMPPGSEQWVVSEDWHWLWGAGNHYVLWCLLWISGVKAQSCMQQALSRELPEAMGKDAESAGEGKWVRCMERLRWHPTCSSWLTRCGWRRGDVSKMLLKVRQQKRIMGAAGGRLSLCEVRWRMSVGSQKGPELLSVGACKHGSFRIQLRDGERVLPSCVFP